MNNILFLYGVTKVFENFLSTTEKLRTSFSSAGEQFQASRKKSFPLSRRFKDRKFEKTKLALSLRKSFAVSHAPARAFQGVMG